MTETGLQKQPTYATLSEMKGYVFMEGLWHRVSQWRGLRPGFGIPDNERLAQTLCARPIFNGAATLSELPKSVYDDDEECPNCEREYGQIRIRENV